MLRWQTGYEAHNLGYNIYREQNGKRVAITPSLVAGSALMAGSRTQLTAGASYVWYDQIEQGSGVRGQGEAKANGNQQSTISNQQSRYWLEDVDLDGTRTLHGPIVPLVEYRQMGKLKGPARAALLGEVSHRTPASGVEMRSWASAFAAERARLRSGVADPDALVKQREIEALPGIKIGINREGWYRITQAELLAAGLDPNVNAPQLQLYTNGRAVPIRQSGDGVHLTSSDYIEFYGGVAESPTDANQTYYLVVNAEGFGSRIQELTYREPEPLPAPSGPTGFDYTVERKERMIYFSSLRNGETENFFGQIVSSTAGSANLRHQQSGCSFSGCRHTGKFGSGAAGSDRTKSFGAGSLQRCGSGHDELCATQTIRWRRSPVPATALVNGDNTLELTSLGGAADVSLVDTIRLTYAHSYAADNNALAFSVDSEATKQITGFTSDDIRVIDITDPHNVIDLTQTVEVSSAGDGSYNIALQVQGASFRRAHTLLVFADSTAASAAVVKENDASSWWSQTAGADYVMIGTKELLPSLEPLAQFRRNQGLVVNVVDVEDLYDEYSFGRHTPQAIRDYLETALTSWTRQPRFVLLGGDASYDPKNYLGQGANDLVPTRLIDTSLTETASDDWLADFSGDGIADLAVGRLPVRTAG